MQILQAYEASIVARGHLRILNDHSATVTGHFNIKSIITECINVSECITFIKYIIFEDYFIIQPSCYE